MDELPEDSVELFEVDHNAAIGEHHQTFGATGRVDKRARPCSCGGSGGGHSRPRPAGGAPGGTT